VDRNESVERLRVEDDWDVLVIGGGATGVGTALDAASRGYRTLLVERGDFGQGTSSRSTKLVHGGVRYLRQGNLTLVTEALKERAVLRRNAPHLVHDLPFVVPSYDWWEGPFYGVGLKIYDLLAGQHGFGKSRRLSREETIRRLPGVETAGLRGGVVYHDGQFDDARLVVHLARTATEQGAALLNYAEVLRLTKSGDLVQGAVVRDRERDTEHVVSARVVISATGVFADEIRRLDDPAARPVLRPSQGIHLVLDRSFLPSDSAILVPSTDDGRVVFLIPWQGRVLVGTTDTPVERPSAEPRPLDSEIDFLLEHAGRYLARDPVREDVLSVFAGLRPLVADDGDRTAALARDHTVLVAPSGLVTVTGGKWTTYRRMAEDAVDHAILVGDLTPAKSRTERIRIHGAPREGEPIPEGPHGTDSGAVKELCRGELGARIHPALEVRAGEVVWAARHEMARSVEDVLSRRTRALLRDARAAAEAAPAVAELLAGELGRGGTWREDQIRAFRELAAAYLPARAPERPRPA
jgi:glycerol-3-phosphate dehydrogenase